MNDWDIKPIDLVTRDEWGARPPKTTVAMHHPLIKAVLTYDLKIDICKTKEDCIIAMQELQRRHMDDENSDDIKYNFLIGGDRRVYEGRGWHNKPCRSLKYSAYYNKRMDIGFLGNYIGTEAIPKRTIEVVFDLLEIGILAKHIIRHYDLHETRDSPKYGKLMDPDTMPMFPDPVDEISHDDFFKHLGDRGY